MTSAAAAVAVRGCHAAVARTSALAARSVSVICPAAYVSELAE
jgi:hypothetical protein